MTKNILKMAMMLVAMMLPYMAFAQKQTFALYDRLSRLGAGTHSVCSQES